jgi:D-aminopeptidase
LFRPFPAVLLLLLSSIAPASEAQTKPRARDLGIPIGGTPGTLDAITDVHGVEVGHTTLISGNGKLVVGKGPVRTGVTAILPRGKASADPVFAAWFTLNGSGEMTGTTWVEESGLLWGPITTTNTMSVGMVRDAVVAWSIKQGWSAFDFSTPVVGETWDGPLNDISGFHVRQEDVYRALDGARSGPVAEGNVGGGTGMICHEFKGGIGTASRVTTAGEGAYTVGVLVQCNYGLRRRLSVAGVPVGEEIPDLLACRSASFEPTQADVRSEPACDSDRSDVMKAPADRGSIIVVVGTDAPLLPHQLKRLAKRVALGVGRMGGLGGNTSGDIFFAFSTANPGAAAPTGIVSLTMLSNEEINPLLEATIQATEEAILNAMLAAETMTGADGYRVYALPADRLMAAMRKYGR